MRRNVLRTPRPRRGDLILCSAQDGTGVVVGSGMFGVRVLGKDDELPRIIGPVAQGMKVERTLHCGRLGRCLDPPEGVSVSHAPPAVHVDLRRSSGSEGWRPYTGIERRATGAGTGLSHVRTTDVSRRRRNKRPSVGIRCWPSPGSSDSPGAQFETLPRHMGPRNRTHERPV